MNFRALVVTGNQKGEAGFGLGKAQEVPEAIRKATERARKNRIRVPLKGTTIPFAVWAKFSASKILLKPAVRGHGMVVGKTMRAFLEVLGVQDIVGKCLGSTNAVNVLNATVKALQQFTVKE